MITRKYILCFVFLFGVLPLNRVSIPTISAEEMPTGYYSSIEGKKDKDLKSAIRVVIRPHTVIPYGKGAENTWGVFFYSDRNEQGYCMDMYCDDWQLLSTPGMVADGCNIEHSFAKSWWGGAKNDAYQDCYHLNPSNATANSSRSNYPLGVPTQDLKDQAVTGSLRVGKATYAGQTFWVFEPKDEYKGDFARAYFYMATCYGDELTWRKDNTDVGSYFAMRASNDSEEYLEFLDWEIDILLAWHRQDPVSEKEINRQDAVSDFQHNRNPYIDYPELVEYIWGNKKGVNFYFSSPTDLFADDVCSQTLPVVKYLENGHIHVRVGEYIYNMLGQKIY